VSDRADSVTDPTGAPVFAMDEHELVGGEVGGYIVDGILGKGGVGIVYAATHPVIGKRVAIKVLRPAMSNNPVTVERFVQEARSVNRIGHPSIVDIFAFGTLADGRHYFVMDLLEGESLRARVKRGPLAPRDAMKIIDEIAGALIAAHAKGFIHRDLKPDNVFLVTGGGRSDIKLLDFGLAKLTSGDRAFRTATGTQLGTPDYMSPEQLRGSGDVDERTDTFSLGVMTCELLAGTRPQRLGEMSFERPILEVIGAATGVPRELVALVGQMTELAAARRPSLVQIRATIASLAPILARPSSAIASPPVALGTAPSLASFTPSMVGARPLLPTPPHGARIVPAPSALAPPALEPPVAAPPVVVSSLPSAAPLSNSSGLRPSGAHSAHAATRLGVPPPPVQARPRMSRPQPAEAPPRPSRNLWLLLALGLVLVAAGALVVVLAM
jgi:eukaryotic-like serine/threonine-protein kinase